MSTGNDTNESMAKKKRKPTLRVVDGADGEAEAKKPPGRPKVLPPDLDKRHQLRCASREFEVWEKYAVQELGFPNVSAWIRKAVNDALPKHLRPVP